MASSRVYASIFGSSVRAPLRRYADYARSPLPHGRCFPLHVCCARALCSKSVDEAKIVHDARKGREGYALTDPWTDSLWQTMMTQIRL